MLNTFFNVNCTPTVFLQALVRVLINRVNLFGLDSAFPRGPNSLRWIYAVPWRLSVDTV